MCIVTGPNIDLATKLIKRLKAIFSNKLGIYFTNKETVLELNGCMIEAYPSNHLDSFRSLTNPKFIFLDEGRYVPERRAGRVRHVSERYIGKSRPLHCDGINPCRSRVLILPNRGGTRRHLHLQKAKVGLHLRIKKSIARKR